MNENSDEIIKQLGLSREEILNDYRIATQSREASYSGRREVMSGKAKFGIFGDGKELPQVAMAHFFQPGDWRSGYYRDQTLMFATGMSNIQQYFAQLYAHTDENAEPITAGRAMNGHYGTRSIDSEGKWKDLTAQRNSAVDVSPTAAQMPRAVGLAYASKLFRQLDELKPYTHLSKDGNEITFATIGNASTAEGLFWESVNAIGVLRSPAIITVYDDGYGISVTNESEIAKENISELISGFERPEGVCCDGYDIYIVNGWDYPALVKAYRQAAETARVTHMPSFIHVKELTQPQGHSTSGSHERYKSKERLAWEAEWDNLKKFRDWILGAGLAGAAELDAIEAESKEIVEEARKEAWEAYLHPILDDRRELVEILGQLEKVSIQRNEINELKAGLQAIQLPVRRDLSTVARKALTITRQESFKSSQPRQRLTKWRSVLMEKVFDRFHSHLFLVGSGSALQVEETQPVYSSNSPEFYGFELLNAGFDLAFQREPRLVAFGEDVGFLGDVNQGMRGLQAKYGLLRVSDTGIREATILGQAIGMALRGLRPIAEMQYLDYALYALQIMSDDLANLLWRTKGGQRAPVIVRTRGHRLEGIWHSGSPMSGILNLTRGMLILTPRDMTRAVGFYNTMLKAEEPGMIVEVLNGYRLKERLPDNLGDFTIPVGIPEVLRTGSDVTVVTYGACCRIVMEAANQLSQVGIDTEVIDVQSLMPFDLKGKILESLKKTSRILFVDEDVPGGTSALMLQEVIENQGGYFWLDSAPQTLSATPHRPAYGSDGDYWSKPNVDSVFEKVYEIMHEADPVNFPSLEQDASTLDI
jgi:2-oxoisovalerate dehydrogenase E1 component